MIKGLAVSALIALCVLNLLLVAVVLALANVMPGWGAALVVGLTLTAMAAIIASAGLAQTGGHTAGTHAAHAARRLELDKGARQ